MALSITSKLGCKSWSLQAVDTCPGARDDTGAFVQACEACYARYGNYRFKNVKNLRLRNNEQWKNEHFVADMALELQNERYFRWFDSGDAYNLALVDKIKAIIEATPNTLHWFPTRMHKFTKFQHRLEWLNRKMPNVVVRYSADNFDEVLDVPFSSTILTRENPKVYNCPAYKQGGKCLDCRACWSKDVPVVGYLGHGKRFSSMIKLKVITNATT